MAGIDDIIAELADIVDTCRADRSRAGYFAAMYLAVTKEIKQNIEDGAFEKSARMEALDVVFAQRYIDAFHAQETRRAATAAWQTSFAGNRAWRPIIVQQLLTGMNAHINLDLGIAAATIAPGDELADLRRDFDTINEVLAGMTRRFTDDVAQVSPWIGFLDRIGGRTEQHIIRFSIDEAREAAWNLAEELAPLSPSEWQPVIDRRDRWSTDFAEFILRPGVFFSTGLFVIRMRESGNIVKVINTLGDP